MAIDAKKLTIKPNGFFNSLMRPLYFDDEEAKANGYDELQPKALEITGLSREVLAEAPLAQSVWKNFGLWTDQFTVGSGDWGRPILCGYNINNYDLYIVDRLCQMYGPYNEKEERQSLFHPVHRMDVMNDIWRWTYFQKINPSNSISMDNVRKWLGILEDKAHNAAKDVLDTTFMLIKFMSLYQAMSPKIKFKDSFAKENEQIKALMKEYNV